MADPLDYLEVAKLAASIGSQLKDMDSRTDGTLVNANRLDTRKFIQNVVHAANPQAKAAAHIGPQVTNSEEAELLEMLNRQAIGQVPDISQGSPKLIPLPVYETQQAPPQPQQFVQQAQPIPQYQQPVYTSVAQTDPIREIAEAVKSIDLSLQALCTVFIVKAKKKKKRKVAPKQQILQQTPPEVSTTSYVTAPKIQPSTQESPQNVS